MSQNRCHGVDNHLFLSLNYQKSTILTVCFSLARHGICMEVEEPIFNQHFLEKCSSNIFIFQRLK